MEKACQSLLSITQVWLPKPSQIFFLATLNGLQDLNFLTRDPTQALKVKALSPNHETTRETPQRFFNNENIHVCKGGINEAWKEF